MAQHLGNREWRYTGARQPRGERVTQVIDWEKRKSSFLQCVRPSLAATSLQRVSTVFEVGEYPLGEFRSDKIPPPQKLCLALRRNWHSPYPCRRFAASYL